ncbi:hypothetical protein crov376 [Cafeteria roenbergensis virus]|uniref:Uncharacterized protein n=1 Tax=Cafeteria roenbergensis virus (strain BV-PW1) TaxID=693272 RepID=E3T5E7_CROVB|nr:hypothetical protein crov376 [Cafeteria roenbergensis virus BV-PW1]ADO67410.1 hypothetical protein crov376 [Cafeteria roenbergensis virus BV-PW1]
MNRNILLTKRNKKKHEEHLKNFQESVKKNLEEIKNKPDPNKYNPDVKCKYQKYKNIRSTEIKPLGLKIENNPITEKKANLSKLLQNKISERNEKITIDKKPFKKRILTRGTEDYETHKETITELKKMIDAKINEGKETNNAILSHYEN